MRIWLGIGRLWRGGGTETHVITLAQALRRQGHQVTVCTSGGAWVKRVRQLGIPVQIITLNSGRASATSLRKRLRQRHVDVLHAHDGVSLRAFSAALDRYHRGSKLVYTVHGLYIGPQVLAVAGSQADGVIAVSRSAAVAAMKWIPQRRIQIVPNGVDTSMFRPVSVRGRSFRLRHRVPETAHVVAYCGRFTFDKVRLGRRVVRLLAHYSKVYPGVHILVAGRGAKSLRLRASRVHVVGHVEAVGDFFNACDVVIATGRTAVEAALAGANVIALGRAGLQGRVTTSTLTRLSRTNFGDHGPRRRWTNAQLVQELNALHGRRTTGRERAALRRAIVHRLSATRMARQTLAVYRR